MPEIDKSAQKLSRKWIFSVIGLVILAILAFSYSKTANLLPNFPRISMNNQGVLTDEAKKAGYEIAWNGDSNDTTGRAILAKGKRSAELFPEKLGWASELNTKLNLIGLPAGFGTFKSLQVIPKSKDYYLILANPLSKPLEDKTLVVRIADRYTALNVDNLDYGSKNKNVAPSVKYGIFSNIDKKTLDKIIKPGDVLEVFTVPLNQEDAKKNESLIQLDNNNIPYAATVVVRRFGGIEELQKELK